MTSLVDMKLKYHYYGLVHHYVATIVDNGLRVHIVKYFGKRKRWWHYEALPDDDLAIEAKYNEEMKAFKQKLDKLLCAAADDLTE